MSPESNIIYGGSKNNIRQFPKSRINELELSDVFGHSNDEGGDSMEAKEYFDILQDDARRRDEYYREMDKRAEERAKALEDRLMADRRESEIRHEQRIKESREERRETEARLEQHMKEFREDRRESDQKFNEAINRLEDRMSGDMSELRGEFRETKRWIIGLTIGTIISMLALASGTIFGIVSLIKQ